MEKLQKEIENIVFEEIDLQSFSAEQNKKEPEKEPKLGEVREYNAPEEKKELEKHTCRETGEVLTDPVDISYYKVEQKEQIIENLLLGEFDSEGKYVIEKSFLKELVKVKKVIKEQFENKYILISKLGEFGELKFTVQIGEIEEGKKIAVLKFIEISINLNDEREILRTYVASYKDDNDQFFLEKVFKLFNIVKQEDYDGKEIDPEELLLILRRFKTLYALKTKRVEGLDYISNTYIDEVLAILKKYPSKFSTYISRKYFEFLKEMVGVEGKPKYYIKIKKFLDKLINSSKKEAPKELMDEIKRSREEYCKNYNNVIDPIMAPAESSLNKQKAKAAVKSVAKASGDGAKKKKGSVKKKNGAVKKAKASAKKKTSGISSFHIIEPNVVGQKTEREKKEVPVAKVIIVEDDVLDDIMQTVVVDSSVGQNKKAVTVDAEIIKDNSGAEMI